VKYHPVRLCVLALLPLIALCPAQADNDKGKTKHLDGKGHVIVTPDQIKWWPAPASLPPGAQLAILDGDPSKAGLPYTIRAKFPDGYKVPPHWHPVDENVTVLKGIFGIGRGEKFDPSAGEELPVGSYSKMPKRMRHFAWVKGETIIQIHGVGPFVIHYVNPADDPRKKSDSQ